MTKTTTPLSTTTTDAEASNTATRKPHTTCTLLEPFQTFGWEPDPTVSDDTNYMDLTLLVTRSSQLRQGSMACLLVRDDDAKQNGTTPLLERLVSVATNRGIYGDQSNSDVHAEVAAVCDVARYHRSRATTTDHCTAYITMPPCKACCAVLYSAGIRRVVSRRRTEQSDRLLADLGVEMIVLPDDRSRVDAIVARYKQQQQQAVVDVEEGGRAQPDATTSEKKRKHQEGV